MRRFLFLLALGVAGAILFWAFLFEGIYLASDSMAPTLPKGTHVIVNKFIFLFREPKRREVVMFEAPQNPGKGMVKRVIAVGGDIIALKNKRVYLNNQLLEERYVQYVRPGTLLIGDNLPPIEVPEGYVVVMGDNRDVSGDSRDWKSPSGEWSPYLPLSCVKGLVRLP